MRDVWQGCPLTGREIVDFCNVCGHSFCIATSYGGEGGGRREGGREEGEGEGGGEGEREGEREEGIE